jgi:hypothetical protein
MFFPNVILNQKLSYRILKNVEDYYYVNEKYLYAIKTMSHSIMNEMIVIFNVTEMKKEPRYIRMNNKYSF